MEFIDINKIVEEPIELAIDEPDFAPEADDTEIIKTNDDAADADGDGDGDVPFDPEDAADSIIEILDAVQTIIYPSVYEAALFTKKEKITLRQVQKKIREAQARTKNKLDKDGEITVIYTPHEVEQIGKLQDLEAYGDEVVPLDDRERRQLRKPLLKIMGNANVKLSPNWTFILSLLVITVTRTLPLFGAMRDKKKRQANEKSQ